MNTLRRCTAHAASAELLLGPGRAGICSTSAPLASNLQQFLSQIGDASKKRDDKASDDKQSAQSGGPTRIGQLAARMARQGQHMPSPARAQQRAAGAHARMLCAKSVQPCCLPTSIFYFIQVVLLDSTDFIRDSHAQWQVLWCGGSNSTPASVCFLACSRIWKQSLEEL
jgi:hypothetical protein